MAFAKYKNPKEKNKPVKNLLKLLDIIQKISWTPPSKTSGIIKIIDSVMDISIPRIIKSGNMKKPAKSPVHLAHKGN